MPCVKRGEDEPFDKPQMVPVKRIKNSSLFIFLSYHSLVIDRLGKNENKNRRTEGTNTIRK